jgi:hypothetical protein
MINNSIFDSAGYLPDKTHQFTKQEFIEGFCDPARFLDSTCAGRRLFAPAFSALCQWAEAAGARSVIVGGSFITKKPSPTDMDVLVVFAKRSDISSPSRGIGSDKAIIDIQCISEDEPELLQAFLQLIGADRRYIGRGLAQIKFHPSIPTLEKSHIQSRMMEIAMLSYIHRNRSTRSDSSRLVIPIHGIRSDAAWIPKFTFLASTQNWGVAPFVYGFESGTILGDEKRKAEIVDEFRLWLDEIRKTFNGTISVVAHSFGTYIIGRYLETAGSLLEQFGGIVLAGSILNTEFKWDEILENEAATMVLNTRSQSDEWVKWLPEGGIRFLAKDPLMGKAAVEGFKVNHDRLLERQSNLLTHSSMFESDVILRIWLPFLDLAEKLVPFGYEDDEYF